MDRDLVSRRRFLYSTAAVGGLAVSGLLAACGGGGGAPVAKTAAPSEKSKEGPAAAEKPKESPAAAEKSKESPVKGEAKPSTPPTATPIPEASLGSGATEIAFWSGLTGSDGEGMQRIMERYADENKEVTVKFQRIVWRTFYDKLSASLVAGNPPDMWIFHSEQVIRYASRKVLKQLDDFAEGKVVAGKQILIGDMGYTLPYAQYEGKLFSVPLDQYTWCMLFNKDLAKAAGLDPDTPPKTGQEFIEWCRQMTVDNSGKKAGESGFDPKSVKQWGYYYNAHGPVWNAMLIQQGVPPMIEGADAKDVNTDSPEAIKALEEMVSWHDKHQFAPAPSGINVMEGFWAGKVGMTYNGVWNTNAIKQHPEIPTGVSLTPIWYGNEVKATFSGHQMAMPASAEGKKMEEGWKTIVYISDHTLDWAKEGQTPARKSILNSPEFKELWPQSVFAQQLPTGVVIPPHVKLIELNDQIGPALEAALNGQLPAEQALKEAAERQRQILARRD